MSRASPSTFVTVVAWLTLIFSGLTAATGLLQSVLVAFLMPMEPMSPAESSGVPDFFTFIFDNLLAVVLALTAFWSATFIFAVGLLRRREWGRKGLVVVLVFLCAMTLVVAVLQQVMMTEMVGGQRGAAAPAEAAAMILTMRIAMTVFAAVFTGALGWVAWRLNSSGIRAEFS